MSKYSHPLEVLVALNNLNKLIKENDVSQLLLKSTAYNSMFYVVDKDNEDFSFSITRYEVRGNTIFFYIYYRPKNHIATNGVDLECSQADLPAHFRNWYAMVQGYHNIPFDTVPNFEEIFQDEYFEAINIDEDGDTRPFNHIKMLTWHNLLEGVEETILESGEITEEEKADLISESKELRESLGQRTQKSFAKGASKLFAKIKSASISLMKEVGKEITKRLAKAALDAGTKILKDGPQFMHDVMQNVLNSGGPNG